MTIRPHIEPLESRDALSVASPLPSATDLVIDSSNPATVSQSDLEWRYVTVRRYDGDSLQLTSTPPDVPEPATA